MKTTHFLFVLLILPFIVCSQTELNPISKNNHFLLILENGFGINKSKSTNGTQFQNSISLVHAINFHYRRTFDNGFVITTGVVIGVQDGAHKQVEYSPFNRKSAGYNILMRHELMAGYDFLTKQNSHFILHFGIGIMQHNTRTNGVLSDTPDWNNYDFYKKYPNQLIPYFTLSSEYGVPLKNGKTILLRASYNLSTKKIYDGYYRYEFGNEGRIWNSGNTFSIGIGLQF